MAIHLLSPSFLVARETPSARGFCAMVDKHISRIDQRITDQEIKLKAKRKDQSDNLTKRESERDSSSSGNRSRQNLNRQKLYVQLEAHVTTEAQKQAIKEFRKAIEAAVSVRDNTIDAAIKELQRSVEQIVSRRRLAIDMITKEFKSAEIDASKKARIDCARNISPTTARTTFQVSMKRAQNKFRNDRQAIEKSQDQRESVRAAQKQAVAQAVADFKVSVEKARVDLKAAF